ncbi:MAG: DUF3793 family protein [Oscillospiraceae bacterium]|nr:DUF3793 family protein [Oscillospiraceae bacterium]
MYDALLVRHCAPTLAGLKTGSLFSCSFAQPKEMHSCLRHWNGQLYGKGLHVLPLCRRKGRTLIYLYRSSALLSDFNCKQTAQLLKQRHYPLPCPERCIAHLIKQLAHGVSFPHEIGLFLGYPPEDVLGFIRNPAACKFSGCWKVYGDVPTAQTCFDAYRKCTQTCCALLALGVGLEQLATAY